MKAILVERRSYKEKSNLDELQSLAKSAGYTISEIVEQVRYSHPKFNIGPGKAKELAEKVKKNYADIIIFGNELKIAQIYNLAKITKLRIIDKFELILEIFFKRAHTEEAKLQIKLAQLRYELTHAKEKVRFAKIDEQPGFQGLGKYKIDVYYETIRRQVNSIEKKLGKIKKTRKLHRYHRNKLGYPAISLAGYTNSGKSTLFNILTKEKIQTNTNLFTTLSTTIRMINLLGENMLITDTVGFIDNLPLTLIQSFRSTLEETIFSDLILLVIDVSDSLKEIERKIICCIDTIKTIGANGVPLIPILNKIDLLKPEQLENKKQKLTNFFTNFIEISALYGKNINSLKKEIFQKISSYIESHFVIPLEPNNLSFISWIFNNTQVTSIKYKIEKIELVLKSSPQIAEKIRKNVKKLGGSFKHETT